MFAMHLPFHYVFAKYSLKCCLTLMLNDMSPEGVNINIVPGILTVFHFCMPIMSAGSSMIYYTIAETISHLVKG